MLAIGLRLSVAALAGFALAWVIQGARMDRMRATVAAVDSVSATAALDRHVAVSAAVNRSDAALSKEFTDAKNDLEALRACVAAGKCGLRVAAKCTAPVTPATAPAASMDDAASPRLDPAVEQDYYALRAGLIDMQAKLAMCQAYAKAVQ